MTVVGSIAEIHRYPVKSCQGELVPRAHVDAEGVEHDRTFAVRDLETGKVASAKRPRPWRALLDCTARVAADGVTLSFPDGDTIAADDPAIDGALCDLIGRRVTLEEAHEGDLGAYASTWPRIEGLTLEGDHDFPVALATTSRRFVDLAALHLMTTSTLAQLRALAPDSAITEQRFRPNVVIDTGTTADGFVEDGWTTLRIGESVSLTVSSPTVRCVMTTLAQPGLPRDLGVLRAAAENRRTFDGLGTFACAGVYAEVTAAGPIAVGDPVTLT